MQEVTGVLFMWVLNVTN